MLPQRLIKQVKTNCTMYLWILSNNLSRMAPMAWQTLNLLRLYGGFNIRDLGLERNKAAIVMLFWSLVEKKDKFGVNRFITITLMVGS